MKSRYAMIALSGFVCCFSLYRVIDKLLSPPVHTVSLLVQIFFFVLFGLLLLVNIREARKEAAER